MKLELILRITLVIIYSLILVFSLRWSWQSFLKKQLATSQLLPLTFQNVLKKAIAFGLVSGSSFGILAVFLSIVYKLPIARAIWVPLYAMFLCFIAGCTFFPFVQWLSQRFRK